MEVFWFFSAAGDFFQKVIKINDFFMNILFSWVYVINFVSNIFMIMKKFKKWSKILKILKNNFFFKNNEKNMS